MHMIGVREHKLLYMALQIIFNCTEYNGTDTLQIFNCGDILK